MYMNMPIEFIVRGGSTDSTEALREHAIRRVSFAVRRFSHRVRHVTVRLVDLNGPRRGVDSRSTVTANLVDGGQLFVEATAAWPFAAIALAAGRLLEALRRDTGRHTEPRGESAATPRHRPEGHLRVP
jgi:ribosome-associated translation inhibitor RaiA